ncbi:hypothetical protein AVEN_36294-1 [Araneus ventricosus]|uniref:Uncharacterized protein n=1 Tax=Araneus ventricosus TaxID=182803 RepID=A0A4Y2TMZ3_ARAVE|nr:hypothetical protein AVEN_36294-1 [Araneus ventricosus]
MVWMEWSITFKRDIHGKTVPVHFEHVAPHDSSFQPIHLDGSFAGWTAPTVNHHLRALRSPTFTAPPPFYCFCFCERGSLPFPTIVFQFYGSPRRVRDWMKIQILRTRQSSYHRIFTLMKVLEQSSPNDVERCHRECPA